MKRHAGKLVIAFTLLLSVSANAAKQGEFASPKLIAGIKVSSATVQSKKQAPLLVRNLRAVVNRF